MAQRIGLIGIGLVGAALAERLLREGYSVHGYDIAEDRLNLLETMGGIVHDSPRSVADQCRILFISLKDTATVRSVIEGPDGVLAAATTPETLIDTTTGDPDETVDLYHSLGSRHVRYLDATISGSSDQIRQREAVFMVGGDSSVVEDCSALFDIVSRRWFHVGEPGTGSKTKLASNLILGLNRAALAEGLVFAERLGLDLPSFIEVIRHTPAYSRAIDTKAAKMIEREYAPQSKVSQHRKDLDIILKYAQVLHQPLPLTEIHRKLLIEAEASGRAELDTCAIVEQIRDLTRTPTTNASPSGHG